ncbi:electron transfer flavoprotein subunit beta/FixA family protein [Paenibacillus sp. MBLB4367]|uniref:electron transfer flavoprotein subunit beta/FixA family protein n=1 Tax=Paenibacillus sp. MBLB4367 TaxID=3384767 RepID=UPI0039081353
MNIVVCLKQTLDTEERVVSRAGTVEPEDGKRVVNPYDDFALEEAIRLKEKIGGTVTVITVGPQRAEAAIRSAFAVGADEALLIHDERLFGDEYAIAETLAAAIRTRADAGKPFDLVLAGHMSVDNGASQGGPRIAELLGIPHIAAVTELVVSGSEVKARRDVEGDEETVTVKLPLLATAQQGLNEPRYPTLPGIMKAKKKPIETATAEQIGLDSARFMPKTITVERFLPPPKQPGRLMTGELHEQAAELVRLLHEEAKML